MICHRTTILKIAEIYRAGSKGLFRLIQTFPYQKSVTKTFDEQPNIKQHNFLLLMRFSFNNDRQKDTLNIISIIKQLLIFKQCLFKKALNKLNYPITLIHCKKIYPHYNNIIYNNVICLGYIFCYVTFKKRAYNFSQDK